MNRRKFLSYMGCGCGSLLLSSCTTAPITERKQLKIVSEAKLNAQAAQIYEKVKEKEKMSDDTKTLNEIKEIGKKMENAISIYFDKSNLPDPTSNFKWEYILIDNDKVKNAWCMPGGKIAVYSGMLKITKNTKAIVIEERNNKRENFFWFLKRNFRYGASSNIIYKKAYGLILGLSFLIAKFFLDFTMLIISCISLFTLTKKSLYRVSMYFSRILGLIYGFFGFQYNEYE